MLRTSRKYAFICLLICIFLISCTSNLLVTPTEELQPPATTTSTLSPSPTPEPDQEWFGMQIPSDLWQTEEINDALYQHGLLTHRSLNGCRAWILSTDPVYINGYDPDESASTLEHFQTAETRIDLRRIRDHNGNLRDIYFEVFDTTGRRGFDEVRLAYVLVDSEKDQIYCLEAVYALLITLKPDHFPDLPADQG